MNTKVVHLRMKKEDILSAIEYFEEFCATSKEDKPPISTVVSTVLIATMSGLRETGHLPKYTKEDINLHYVRKVIDYSKTRTVDVLIQPEIIPEKRDWREELDGHELLSSIAFEQEDNSPNTYIREQVRANIEDIISKITQPNVELDLTKIEIDDSDLPIGVFNYRTIDKIKRTDLDQSNIFVQAIAKYEKVNKEAYIEALCISFFYLPDAPEDKFNKFLQDVYKKCYKQMSEECNSGGLDLNL